jgi:hypothetical protein
MKRSIEITNNSFFSIFSDAVLLYDLALSERDNNVSRALSTSSILSVNYALEAAANSFLQTLDTSSKISAQIDRFPTLDKFDFILQWHKDYSLPRGSKEVQIIKKLIDQRNDLVHPKVKIINLDVITSAGDEKMAYFHETENSDVTERCNVTKMVVNPSDYTADDALIALKSLVNFLNELIENWWGIDTEVSAILLMKSWNGSIQAKPVMYLRNELEVVLKHKDVLKIRFIGLDGIIDQYP